MCARADIEPKKGDKKMEKRLSSLSAGEVGRIKEIHDGNIAPRLYDIGFSPGDEVECVIKMPRGGMGAYLIKKSVVALRAADAYLILVGEVEP